jgi:hypothetical protein
MNQKTIEERRELFLKTLQNKLDSGTITIDEYHSRRHNVEITYIRLKKKGGNLIPTIHNEN